MLECFLAKLRGAVKSLTIWLNGIGLAVVAGWNEITESVPQLQQYVDAQTYKYLALSLVVGNIIVRFRTRSPLEHK